MQSNKKIVAAVAAGALAIGSIASIGLQAFAATTTAVPVVLTSQVPEQPAQGQKEDIDNIQDGHSDESGKSGAVEESLNEKKDSIDAVVSGGIEGGHEDAGPESNNRAEEAD